MGWTSPFGGHARSGPPPSTAFSVNSAASFTCGGCLWSPCCGVDGNGGAGGPNNGSGRPGDYSVYRPGDGSNWTFRRRTSCGTTWTPRRRTTRGSSARPWRPVRAHPLPISDGSGWSRGGPRWSTRLPCSYPCQAGKTSGVPRQGWLGSSNNNSSSCSHRPRNGDCSSNGGRSAAGDAGRRDGSPSYLCRLARPKPGAAQKGGAPRTARYKIGRRNSSNRKGWQDYCTGTGRRGSEL